MYIFIWDKLLKFIYKSYLRSLWKSSRLWTRSSHQKKYFTASSTFLRGCLGLKGWNFFVLLMRRAKKALKRKDASVLSTRFTYMRRREEELHNDRLTHLMLILCECRLWTIFYSVLCRLQTVTDLFGQTIYQNVRRYVVQGGMDVNYNINLTTNQKCRCRNGLPSVQTRQVW